MGRNQAQLSVRRNGAGMTSAKWAFRFFVPTESYACSVAFQVSAGPHEAVVAYGFPSLLKTYPDALKKKKNLSRLSGRFLAPGTLPGIPEIART